MDFIPFAHFVVYLDHMHLTYCFHGFLVDLNLIWTVHTTSTIN